MKTILFYALFFVISVNGFSLNLNFDNNNEPKEAVWVKSETGIWLSDYNTWYKLDKSNVESKLLNIIKVSHNKKKWTLSTNAAWQDKGGKWYYISDNRLLCTGDNKHWVEISNKCWLGIDGIWRKFDSNWDLWEAKL